MAKAKWLYAVLFSFLAFACLAWLVTTGRALQFDLPIRQAIHRLASPFLTRIMLAASFIGRPALMPLPGAFCVWRLHKAGRRRDALWFVITTLSAEIILQLLGLAFHRARPEPFFNLPRPDSWSFPSGHAFMCTVFYLLFTFLISGRPGVRAAAVAFATLIGFSRVYLGFHYPTDVLAGFAAGAFLLGTYAGLHTQEYS